MPRHPRTSRAPRGARGRGRGGQSAAGWQSGGGGLLAGGGGPSTVSQTRRITRSTTASVHASPVSNGVVASRQCGTCNALTCYDAFTCEVGSGWYHPSFQCTVLDAISISAFQSEGGDGTLYKCRKCHCLSQRNGSIHALVRFAILKFFEIVRSFPTSEVDLTR